MKKTIVFDFDGTLVDSFPLIDFCFNETAKHLGRFFSFEDIIKNLGPNEEGLVKKLFKLESHKEAYSYYLKIYEEYHDKYIPSLYNEMYELLKKLRNEGYKILLLTGRSIETLMISLTKLKLFEFFDGYYVGNIDKVYKYENLQDIMKDYNLNSNEMIYVGDSVSDVKECRKSSVEIISVTYIMKDKIEKLKELNPGFVAGSVNELDSLIHSLTK